MKFSDIVALAKAGYKPTDVKALLELCETNPEKSTKESEPEPDPEPGKDEKREPELDAFEKLVQDNNN